MVPGVRVSVGKQQNVAKIIEPTIPIICSALVRFSESELLFDLRELKGHHHMSAGEGDDGSDRVLGVKSCCGVNKQGWRPNMVNMFSTFLSTD